VVEEEAFNLLEQVMFIFLIKWSLAEFSREWVSALLFCHVDEIQVENALRFLWGNGG
jgi:hypothetical protein